MQYLSVGVLATFFTMPSNPSKTKRQIFPNRPERRCSIGSPSLAARKPTISLRQIEKVCFLEPEVKIHPHPRRSILLPVKAAQSFCDAFVEFLLDLLVKIRQTYKDFKHLDPDVQQQILFSISTLIGTVVFYFIFECVHFFIKLQIFIFPRISAPSYTFGIAYSLSYLISVVYQHALNRYLVFTPEDSFCESLLQTYVVYGVSLVGTSIVGSVIMSMTGIKPELVLTITLPLSGLSNYLLLSTLNTNAGSSTLSSRRIETDDELIII